MTALYNLYDLLNYIERAKEIDDLESKKQSVDNKSNTQSPKSSPSPSPSPSSSSSSTHTPATPSSTSTPTVPQPQAQTPASYYYPKFKYQERVPSYEPNVDIYETKDTVYVELETPGVEKGDINIDWNSNTSKLIISGTRKNNSNNNNNNNYKLLVKELEHGTFKREIKLNSNLIDLTTINANLVDGVLVIKISKKPLNTLNIKVNIQ
ncbi:hypothetical protein CYY_010373 [Polysphondylium violaceum]|uniref:SHSP domain-containing protein n=1 Tax=Polysphondylium violaceum TaxID=133409 RepID=A0A8J4PKA5_9MYCE|nr:hypothetical protein CYY_010373 [Polysphondylium violaceum]